MAEDLRAQTRRFYDEVFNTGNVDLVDELAAPDFVEHEEFPDLEPNREGVKQWIALVRSAFPDAHMTVEDIMVEGNKVSSRARLTGTHKGEFLGIPATGNKIDVPTIDIVAFDDEGRATEHWGVTDTGAMMQQLGVVPEM